MNGINSSKPHMLCSTFKTSPSLLFLYPTHIMAHPPPFPPFIIDVESPHRRNPAHYHRGEPSVSRGWYQDGRHLRHVKASKAFIWPKDRKDGSKWGRMKDVLRGDGPDIFVAFGATKQDCVHNRPSRAQWSKHVNLDDTGLARGFDSDKFAPWIGKGYLGGREHGKSYDFRTRKYIRPDRYMWTDAIWQQEPYKNRKWNVWPEAFRTRSGTWWQDARHLPQFRGGPRDGEFGRGESGFHLPYGPHFWPPLPFEGHD
jgi:hypothetical protein